MTNAESKINDMINSLDALYDEYTDVNVRLVCICMIKKKYPNIKLSYSKPVGLSAEEIQNLSYSVEDKEKMYEMRANLRNLSEIAKFKAESEDEEFIEKSMGMIDAVKQACPELYEELYNQIFPYVDYILGSTQTGAGTGKKRRG